MNSRTVGMGRLISLLRRPDDLRYALEKGLGPFVRGVLWQLIRFRKPRLFFLGSNTKFVAAHNLRFEGRVSIGARCYIETSADEPVVFSDGVTLRENAWVQCRSGMNERGAGLELGRSVYVGPNAVIGVGGKITIGAGTQIGAGVSFVAESHEHHDGRYTGGVVTRKGIIVGKNCWFGNNVTILDGVEIGDNTVIGAGSIVTRPLPANCVAVGAPAQAIRNFDQNQSTSEERPAV